MPDSRHAILIGTARHERPSEELRDFTAPEKDVKRLQSLLEQCKFGTFEIQSFVDAPCTEIMRRMDQVFTSAGREDLILFYFSGHGKVADADGSLHLATYDTDPNLLTTTSISGDFLQTLLRRSRCQRTIIILDCCYSGAIEGALLKGERDSAIQNAVGTMSKHMVDGKGLYIISASAAWQTAVALQQDGVSLLTKYIIEALETGRGDLNKDGVITIGELFEYSRERIARHGHQEPQAISKGSNSSNIIVFQLESPEKAVLRNKIGGLVRTIESLNWLPKFIVRRAKRIIESSELEIATEHEALFELLRSLQDGHLTPNQFIDAWFRIDPGLQELSQKADTTRKDRWGKAYQFRHSVLDNGGPAYLLDRGFQFLDWNPAFDELLAKPMNLQRGCHAEDFVTRLVNCTEVIKRSHRIWRKNHPHPLIDIEPLVFDSPEFGQIRFRKIASQVFDHVNHEFGWYVQLNIDRIEDGSKSKLLWSRINERLESEIHWTKYSESYDKLLLNYDGYVDLMKAMEQRLDSNIRTCADLACGTGNMSLSLLKERAGIRMYAFEQNESMLSYFRYKLKELSDAEGRTQILKGDIKLSLGEFPDSYFDAIIMVNALYVILEKEKCLREIQRVLAPNGTLLISTPDKETDLDFLFNSIRENLSGKGLLNELGPHVNMAQARNAHMASLIHQQHQHEVEEMISMAGFDIRSKERTYANAVVLYDCRKIESRHPRQLGSVSA